MKKFKSAHSFGKPKILADPRCAEVLQFLRASPVTLPRPAKALKRTPAWIRYHILALDLAVLVEMIEVHKTAKVTDKRCRARANAFLLPECIENLLWINMVSRCSIRMRIRSRKNLAYE